MHVKEPIQLCGLLWCGAKVYLCKLAPRAACKMGNCGLQFANILVHLNCYLICTIILVNQLLKQAIQFILSDFIDSPINLCWCCLKRHIDNTQVSRCFFFLSQFDEPRNRMHNGVLKLITRTVAPSSLTL